MLRYMLLLLLVNTYGRSLGGPVPEQDSNGKILIGNLLSDLSKHCKNEFVLSQLESKNTSCDVKLNYKVANLQCLMFYEANRLLCNLTAPSTTELAKEFTTQLSEKQNISAFCSEAFRFTVPEMPYREKIAFVFQRDDRCKKVCADDDISTGDTNFFCKYYKWALLNLQPSSNLLHGLSSTVISAGPGATGVAVQTTNAAAIQGSHSVDDQSKITPDTAINNTQTVKIEETNQHTSEADKQESSSIARLADIQNPENPILSSDTTPQKTTQKPDQNRESDKKIEDNQQQQPPVDINEGGLESNGAVRDPDISMPQIETAGEKVGLENINDDTDDTVMDMDDERKDTADDADDQNSNDVEIKLDQESRVPDTRLETQGTQNGEGSRNDLFQNAEGFTEDDDHFFPFFLSAVIVVVVLYVLYHNKNKVGKMFFGLIVEGRQPGRRRTSRGHAYRRLDTLEQAMSANTPAPPSKIIY